jgi:hypothetical protein
MAIQLSDEMIIMTPKLLFKMNLVILFPKERSILYLKMNILFLIQIKEVCDRIKPSFSPSEEGETNFEDGL